MKLTDRRIIMGVGLAVVALGALGFGLGVVQGQRPPTEQQPLPMPVGHAVNLQAVPQAAAVDANATGAVDPLAAKLKARKAAAMDNTTDDEPDAPAEAGTEQPPAPPPAQNNVHGPF